MIALESQLFIHLHGLVGIGVEVEALSEVLATLTAGEVNLFNGYV